MSTRSLAEGVHGMLLSELLNLYLMEKEVAGIKPRTIAWYRATITLFIEFVGDKPVSSVVLEDAQKWILHQMSAKRYTDHPNRKTLDGAVAIPTLNGRIRAIKNFSKYLDEEGFTTEDAFRKIKQHKDTHRIVDVLSDEEKQRLINAVVPRNRRGSRMLVVLALLIDTGVRVSELSVLTNPSTVK